MLPSFRIDRLVTIYGVAPFLRHRQSCKPFLPVLMYHSISDNPEPSVHDYYRLNTSPKKFREQMLGLKEKGYKTVSLDDGLNWLKKKAAYPDCLKQDRNIVLTFDDGYMDFLIHAWPVLNEFRMTATVFLSTGFVGNQSKIFKGRECLTWSLVRDLYGQGISFGSHTVNHLQLYDLNWADIQFELLDSRHCLEDQLGHSVHDFSYPYAYPSSDHAFCCRFDAKLQQCGYQHGVNTVIGTVAHGDDKMRLKRLPVNDCDDIAFFNAKLEGNYDWLEMGQKIFKKLKHRRQATHQENNV